MAKTYEVKVYDSSDNYITTWKDVVSNISFNNEINTAGGELKFTLARNAGDYGEGTDVDFNNRIKVYVFDKEELDGKLIFQGFISAYNPIYKDENVEVTVLSYGEELDKQIIEVSGILDHQQTGSSYQEVSYNGTPAVTGFVSAGPKYDYFGQTFKPSITNKLYSIKLKLKSYFYDWGGAVTNSEVKVGLYSSPPAFVTSGGAPLIGGGGDPDHPFSSANLIANSNYTTVGDLGEYEFIFPTEPSLTSGTSYFFLISFKNGIAVRVYYDYDKPSPPPSPIDPYANGTAYYAYYNFLLGGLSEFASYAPGASAQPTDLYFKEYYTSGGTNIVFSSQDPSFIMQTIIDNYEARGGNITTNNTIDLTGNSESYTFNVNTVLEGIKKCNELSPKGWYWYIDYGTNNLYFKDSSDTPDHIFTLEKDIIDAKFEKRIEDIVNTVYFTGGDTGGGTNFFKKYTNAGSIAKYGIKAVKYSDNRVTLTATADSLANNIIENKSEPELRVTLTILDSNNNQGLGYDIESIKIGDVIAVRNITQQVGLSTWDYGKWDEAYWDYNIYNLSSLQMQIQKIDYNEDTATIYASTIVVDVNKRIDDINRNLNSLQTANNPTAPS